ncbi:hypothetical protein SNE40_002022 [Patella caerulea]|uniref:LITAF domain-containing protein n=1 Tax=Patella caerulea TaxID=87958 RepID=A0AAN8QDV6_PATCE
MSATGPPPAPNGEPPSYQESGGSPYPDEPPPKYEPPKGTASGYQYPTSANYPVQPDNGYQAVVTGAPIIVIPTNRWGPDRQTVYCPFCNAHITTYLDYESGALTWLTSGLLCLFGCWPCCPIPFCIPDLQDVKHRCNLCGTTLGIYRRLS